MEATSLHHTKPYKFQPAITTFNKTINQSPRIIHQTQFLLNKKLPSSPTRLSLKADKDRGLAATRCVAPLSSGSAVGEISAEEEEEDWTWMREKCREREGVVELLECLETEAIMGDDKGKDPRDYNRRAQIFDRSSRVFQALKEEEHSNNNSKDSPL